MAILFNGTELLITLPSSTPSVDVKADIYSGWKEWVKTSDNAKFQPAFDTTGGDAISATQGVAPYYFLRNDLGWRIKPAEEDANIVLVGNLYGRNGNLPIFAPTVGNFTVLISIDRSAAAFEVSSGGGSGTDWTATERSQIRHRLGLDGVAAAPAANPSLVSEATANELKKMIDDTQALTLMR